MEERQKFCNVALLPEHHVLLRRMSEDDQRTMTRQLSVILRREYQELYGRQALDEAMGWGR